VGDGNEKGFSLQHGIGTRASFGRGWSSLYSLRTEIVPPGRVATRATGPKTDLPWAFGVVHSDGWRIAVLL
jgi:hypothetical protein